jgi:hypothetical protein
VGADRRLRLSGHLPELSEQPRLKASLRDKSPQAIFPATRPFESRKNLPPWAMIDDKIQPSFLIVVQKIRHKLLTMSKK